MAKKKWYEKGPVGAIYKAGKDTVAEANRAPIIGQVIRPVSQAINKAGGDISAEAKRVGGNISAEAKRAGGNVSEAWKENVWNPIKEFMGGGAGGQAGPAQPAIDYSKYKLSLAQEAGDAGKAGFSSLISGNENADAIRGNISQQYGALGSLAKMREGTQRNAEQSAIARRLAASGMGASGAGMRMQQQADQQAGRRAAETQLGLASEQARAEAQAQEGAAGRNLQREGMRVGAAQGESDRDFRERQFKYEQESNAQAFAREGEVIAENQRIAREVQRYNERGLFGQLLGDLFGGGAWSMKYPTGQR